MAPTTVAAIVNAIQTDLDALGLGQTKTWSYVEPVVIVPDTCPLLAVWSEESEYQISATGAATAAYDRAHKVIVGWFVFSASMGDTGGTGDPVTIQSLDNILEQLIARISTYAAGIPGIGLPLVAELTRRQLEPKAGSIWAGQLELTVKETS